MMKKNILNQEYSTTRSIIRGVPTIQVQPNTVFNTMLFLPEGEGRIGSGGLRTKGWFKRSFSDKPLITVITIVFNGMRQLEKAILSIIEQTYDNIEYIIIDGGSTDGTIELIKKYEHAIDYWISEKDKGISDAWNKGIKLSNGVVVGLLNADDAYHYRNIEKVSEYYKESEVLKNRFTIFYGESIFVRNGEILSVNRKKFNPKHLLIGFGFSHTTCFVCRDVYLQIGLFDEKYRIAVDTDFLARAYKKGVTFQKRKLVTYMSTGGVSDQKFTDAQMEYLDILFFHGFYSKNKIYAMKFVFKIYGLIRWLVKNKFVFISIKNIKHSVIYAINITYRMLPFFFLKKKFLKFCGIKIGVKSYIHTPVTFYRFGNLYIDHNTVINRNCLIDNRGEIRIGSNVSISHNVKIYTSGHDIDSSYFDQTHSNVTIEDYACIFSNVLIMPGVRIMKGGTVLPGSVVVKDVDEYSVVGGNPARFIRYRRKTLNYNINYGWWNAL